VGVFKAGLTGIVTATRGSGDDTDLESVRLDETFESLDEWDNELQWRHRDVCYGPGINMNDDIEEAMEKPEGWGLWNMGGNCTAWGRNLLTGSSKDDTTRKVDTYALITGADGYEIPTDSANVNLAIYHGADDDAGVLYEGITMDWALAQVARVEAA
jgi:hypothetical protein